MLVSNHIRFDQMKSRMGKSACQKLTATGGKIIQPRNFVPNGK
jgi:hypothetical protein